MSDDNVIPLKSPGEPLSDLIWVCRCGSQQMKIFADGHVECYVCGHAPEGIWTQEDAARLIAQQFEPRFVESAEHSSVDFAKAAVMKKARERTDTAFIFVAYSNGGASTWSDIEAAEDLTEEQKNWYRRRAADCLALIFREPLPDLPNPKELPAMNWNDVRHNDFTKDLGRDWIAVDHNGNPIARAGDEESVRRAAPDARDYLQAPDDGVELRSMAHPGSQVPDDLDPNVLEDVEIEIAGDKDNYEPPADEPPAEQVEPDEDDGVGNADDVDDAGGPGWTDIATGEPIPPKEDEPNQP